MLDVLGGKAQKGQGAMGPNQKKPLNLADIGHVLAWYEAMGVDEAVFEEPLKWQEEDRTIRDILPKKLQRANRTSEEGAPPSSRPQLKNQPQSQKTPANPGNQPQTIGQPPRPQPAVYTHTTNEEAIEAAARCNSLEDLKSALGAFNGCNLKRTAKNLVFYRGAEKADLMIIGEAPGRDEDLVGKPFVGRAGQLLDLMLKAIQLEPEAVHITNIVYWRPPGNRTPTIEESSICRPFLDRQIELVAPKLILFLGGAAAKQMYESHTGITKLRGKWTKLPGDRHNMDTIATLHPAYLLRTPIAKRLAWQDMQMIRQKLTELPPRKPES